MHCPDQSPRAPLLRRGGGARGGRAGGNALAVEPLDGGGSRVTETWSDQRGWLAKKLGGPASGVNDRATHNRDGMEETLRRLGDAATA